MSGELYGSSNGADGDYSYPSGSTVYYPSSVTFDNSTLSASIPDTYTAPELPEGKAMVINVNTKSGVAGAEMVQDTFEQIAADTFDASYSVEDAAASDTEDGSTETGTDAETTGILNRILEVITSIPSAVAEAISALFVPSPDFYSTAISDLADAFSDRMGLLTYPISVLFDFLGRIADLSAQEPVLSWNDISLPGYSTPLIPAGQYDLNDAVGTSQGKQLHDIYLTVVDAVMILSFVDLCRRKYQKILRN